MHLCEEGVDTGRDASGGERFDELRLTAACAGPATWELKTVGDVEDDRDAKRSQNRERTHVDDEVVVSEADASLGDEDTSVPRGCDLVDDVVNITWGKKLTLLHIDRAAGFGGSDDQVGLTRQESRDLKNIGDLAHRDGLMTLVNIGKNREPELVLDAFQHGESRCHARAAKRHSRGSVGFVERRLEDQRDVVLCGNLPDGMGRLEGVSLTLDDARSGNEHERMPFAERHVTYSYLTHGSL